MINREDENIGTNFKKYFFVKNLVILKNKRSFKSGSEGKILELKSLDLNYRKTKEFLPKLESMLITLICYGN
jgi:hypothetical protein